MEIRLRVPVNERDHMSGAPDARVTVVMYGDYASPACQRTHQAIGQLGRKSLSRVRLVYRHFPLVRNHPRALYAAEASEAAAAQGKFWEMNNLLYLNPARLEDTDLRKYAKKLDLDIQKFDREVASGHYAGLILKDLCLSINHGITGTPTIFLNDLLYANGGAKLVEAVETLVGRRTFNDERPLTHSHAPDPS